MTFTYMLFQICMIDLLQRNGLNNVHTVRKKKKEKKKCCQGAFDSPRSFPFLLLMNNTDGLYNTEVLCFIFTVLQMLLP